MHSPFDIMADTYDADFTHTAIGQLQRKQVWEFLDPVLKAYQKPLRILELNCGTGEDALKLSRSGHFVTATDGSERMIERLRQKAQLSENNIRIQVCKFNELHGHFKNEKFDLVISNFGGLNCINGIEMKNLSQHLSALLEDEGKLFLVIMGRTCLWEIIYFSLTGKLGTAFRRKKKSVNFKAGETEMPVYYYSPGSLKKIFRSFYTYCYSGPVGLFIPPSYLEKNFATGQQWLFKLTRLEKRFSRYPLLSNLADHYCIIFQKKESL
jgi:SAM-dependent methyltransferase